MGWAGGASSCKSRCRTLKNNKGALSPLVTFAHQAGLLLDIHGEVVRFYVQVQRIAAVLCKRKAVV